MSSSSTLLNLIKTMPKTVDLKSLKSIRLAKKQKGKRYPPSNVYLQVLGSGAVGAPRSLYVFTDHCRYLFNCGEGSQRLAYEHKVKLSAMEHIFITHKSWENVGGLPGLFLTLQDAGVPEITLHGPPGIGSLYYDTYHFMRFHNLNLHYSHYVNDEPLKSGLYIKPVPLWAEASDDQTLHNTSGSFKNRQNGVENENNVHSPNSHMKKIKTDDESFISRNLSLAYICRPVPKPGSLILERCVEAGVPPGPLLGELKNGNDVTLPDGKVVRASDVIEPTDEGIVFIVIEAPSERYLNSLINSYEFRPHQCDVGNEKDIAGVIVHFTPDNVVKKSLYQEWMSRFSSSTKHIFINHSNKCMGSERVHKIQYKLNNLNSRVFPLLYDKSFLYENASNQSEIRAERNCDDNTLVTLSTIGIRPQKELQRPLVELTPDVYVKECFSDTSFENILRISKKEIINCVTKIEEYPNVIFLGTGSCIPNKTRNTSGILISISNDASIIMDCGEGTYGQLIRLMGIEKANISIKNLKAIYISHLHADHHIGLIRLLQAYKKLHETSNLIPKIVLLAPRRINEYLSSYDYNFEKILDCFHLLPNDCFLEPFNRINQVSYGEICAQLNLQRIKMVPVIHCINSFGVAITHCDGWKLVYSGDTMPCDSLVGIGKGCDLLIHEATMEDGLENDAALKTHSTVSQAIEISRKMEAKFTILTHFSQRYSKVPILPDDCPDNVGIAFDNMKVIFAEEYEIMLERSAKKRALADID